ncbi:uncharacterized protein LOC135071212 [Ostrinia nubilalis]|uniref:uncharacterized protein LOC135071212 n=1 Tax=Ostrinia nubilalis TaxID=29057 RepID=UPI0030823843
MRPSQDSGAPSQSCSCTTCTYKSESENPSIKRIIAGGSRIDKLYYGKYIPLRERKLLDKLVRTRAVYDDIRNQLLSESDVSIKEKANLKPRKHVQAHPMAATDKSSAILELVDLVDKGNVSGGKKLSECCSCCICGSKQAHTHEHTSHMRRHRHAHGKAHGGAYTTSRTSMIRKKMGEVKRSVRFKAKSIRSAPCTCASKVGGMIKRQSQEIIKRLRPEGSKAMLEQTAIESYERTAGGQKKQKIMQKTYQKIRRSKTNLMESMGEGARKLRESQTKVKEHFGAEAKKSLERMKHAKHRAKENVKTVIRKSMRRRQPPSEELNFDELDFPIPKKDSIAKFKERLQRKKHDRDYHACEHECVADECVPENCFKIIKLRRIRREKKEKVKQDKFGVEKNVSVSSGASSVGLQAQQQGVGVTTETERTKKQAIKKKRPSAEPRISVDLGIKKTGIEPRVTVTKSRKVKENEMCACQEAHSKVPPKETKSDKSTTSLPPVASKPKKGQQASSSVSLGIEIRKGKARKTSQKQSEVSGHIHMKKQGRTRHAKLGSELEKSSQTKLTSSKREARAGSHALKRCFCTLKLKGKGNRYRPALSSSKHTTTATQSKTSTRKLDQMDRNVEERVQTKKLNRQVAREPGRGITTGVGVKPKQKSVSSLTSKSLSTGSVANSPKKMDKTEKRTSSSTRALEQVENNESQRQIVRVGSSFSFSIEFYKDKPKDEILEQTQEKVVEDRVKKHTRGTGKRKRLRHRHSQISSSTGKSKYTLTKHSLRRCFCTLKLANAGKKKMKTSRSQGSATSPYTPDIPVSVNRAIATDKHKLLPYECEPGICVPDECDPYECQKLINKRQMKHDTKQSNTDYRKTKSTSSLTSRSIPNKTKKVQSTTATYESPSKKHKEKGKALRRIRTTPSSPERQVVRISSSFSFNVEFYKDNNDKASVAPIDEGPKERPSKSSEITKTNKDRGHQDRIKKRQKSTSMLVKKKNRASFIGPAMKRCFCTLKLQKTKHNKQIQQIDQVTTGTVTPHSNVVDYKNVMHTKGTKTKKGIQYALEPYECEPNVCVPGDCDPYECLKRIQMRQLRESSTLTDKAKMKSATSITYKSKFRSKGALAKNKYTGKKVSTNIESVAGDIGQKPQRQAVRIGSAFSFNIEFHKDLSPSTTIKRINVKEEFKSLKKLKHRGSRAQETTSSHQNTQVAAINKANKAAGIRPMLKRCFCTLKLQENDKKLKTNIKAPKVVTVSRVTVKETKITDNKTLKILPAKKPNQGLNWAAAMYNINSSSTFSKSSIAFQYKDMQSYFHKNPVSSNLLSPKAINKSPCNMLAHSSFILPNQRTQINENYACSENCLWKRANNHGIYFKRIKRDKKYITSQKSANFSEPQGKYTLDQQYLKIVGYNQISNRYYNTMNVQVRERKRRNLKPYECEPGVCVPDECDPYECEKLIRKRLMKKVDRMSGTNIRSKSTSSFASQPSTYSKSKKLQSKRPPREKAKKVPAGGIRYESAPNRKNRQAVRVGSSFSFNVEFSKGQSSPAKYVPRESSRPSKAHKPTKPPRKAVRAKGTKGYGIDRHDQDSQSMTLTENKGSGMKPMMQRCFCTLKLQKKGKNQKIKKEKPVQHAFDRGTATPPNTFNEFVTSRTMMNAGQNTANQKPHKLLPYECEPQFCIPGECNPYECLETIKQRNKKLRDSGTGAMRYRTSSSSNTGQRMRTQARQIQSSPRRHQRSRESTATRSSKVVNFSDNKSRQAVRVGSSFSFNVEFFKENAQSAPSPTRAVRESSPSFAVERAPKQKVAKRKVKGVGLQNERKYKHRDSQMGNVLSQVKSTMTSSFIKRCFCTAKLHGKGKPPRKEKAKPKLTSVDSRGSQATETKSFLKRCFCVLKLKKGGTNQKTQRDQYANTNTRLVNQPITADKNIITTRYKNRLHNLEPYECEPGICVPGECNPYECEKLIKARNVKLDTRGAYTGRARTRSTSSSFKSSKTSKARRTQSNFGSPSTISRMQSTKNVKESPSKAEPLRPSSNRQVVRIGSNFSFNIEFYKDRSPNTEEVQAAAKAIRHKPPRPEPRTKTAKTGKQRKPRHKGSDGNSVATYDRESQANRAKMEDRASGFGPALKRCFCTLKLQKRKIPKGKYNTQKTGTAAMKEIPTLQNRAIMTTGRNYKLKPYECEPHVCVPYECDPYECDKLIKKRNLKETTKGVMTKRGKPIGYKLEPYECEPNFCIPGQCDPYECEKRIKMRNMKHRTSGTSTRRYKGRSISSDIRPTGGRARKVQSAKYRDRRRSKSVSSKPFRSKKSLDSARQSVKIGSGFSFDIEFYKNKSLSSRPEIRPVKQRVKRTKSISSSARQRMARTRNNKMQYRNPMRDTESQILAQKMRDTGVNPFLKRCFCTLKLQKSGNMVSRHAIGRAARDKNVYMATLLPYECEPGVCVPGECDPYECEKRIRRRQMRSQRSGTERSSQDSSTSSGAKYRAAKNQAMRDAQAQKRQKATYAKREYKETRRPTLSSQSSSRQAIKIGSSFKFDVEFYKDNSAKVDERPRTYRQPEKRMDNAKIKPMKTHTRSRSVTSSDIRRQNYKMQTRGSKTESKSTGFGPLLKRCFCTLALHKQKSPPTSKTKATYRNDDLSDLYQFSRNVGVGTKQKFHKLKPYECEPNVCIPGQCDPYECYERIKRRLKDSGTETPRPRKRYASSLTSKQAKYKSANTQAMKDRHRRERPTMTSTMRECRRKQCAPRCSGISGDTNRQAVKIGSNFSFSLEFYKERPNTIKIPKSVYKIKGLDEKPKKYKTNKTSPSQKTFSSRKSHAGKGSYNQKCQADCVKNKSRGTTMGAFIKRCFCTLNLHKNAAQRGNTESRRKIKQPKVKRPPDSTRQAMAQTKEKYTAHKTLPYKLKPYECEPNICVPGECDPYECLERIKRRNIRRHSRRTGTHMRSSQVSVSSMASRIPRSSRRVQSGMKRTRMVSHPQQVPRVVEQPRFANMFDSNRTGVKVGSNLSFNIEFYKDKTQAPTVDTQERYEDYRPKEPKLRRMPRRSTFSESRPKGIHKGIGDKACDRRTCDTQAEMIMKNKAAGVNNMLKRCFCTLKLQKNAMKGPKVYTVNRVAIEEDYRMGYKRAQGMTKKPSNPLLKPLHTNNDNTGNLFKRKRETYDRNQKFRAKEQYHNTHPFIDSKEMKTLYPYIPNKFNKNISKTILLRTAEEYKNNTAKKSNIFNQKVQFASRERRPNISAKNDKANENDDKKSVLKSLFSRLFSNKKFKEKQIESKIVTTKHNANKHLLKPDVLKSSKSDRRPTIVKAMTTPKKTTSLKLTKMSEKMRTPKDEINMCLRHKKFSHYQSGDTAQLSATANKRLVPGSLYPNGDKLYSSNFQATSNHKPYIRSPYETDKIIQMALIQPSKSNKINKKKVNTTTNTQVKKTRTKGVDTCCDNPNTNNDGILSKCLCFINKVKSKKNMKTKIQNGTSETGDKKKKFKGPNVVSDICPCPNKKDKMSSGDKKNAERCLCKASNKHKGKKEVEINEVAGTGKKQKKKSASPAGDAPEMTKDKKGILKNKKTKSGNLSNDISIGANITCSHAEPCPCCKSKKGQHKKDKIKPGTTDGEVKTKKGKLKPGTKGGEGKSKSMKYVSSRKHLMKSKLGKKPYGAKITIKAKGDPSNRGKTDISGSGTPKMDGPCICGMKVCDRESKKMEVFKKKEILSKTPRPCICGSDICALEWRKREEKRERKISKAKKFICECGEELEKQKNLSKEKKEAEKRKMLEEQALLKKYKQEDKKRKEERLKAEKLAEKQAQRYKKTADGVLAAESCLDILKLALTTGGDVARCSSRALMNPRMTYHNLQELAKNPSRGFAAMGDAVSGSGVFSTCKRVRQRCCAMRAMRKLRKKMESNPVTYFMLHAADSDPKKRLTFKKKKKMKRRREPIDFECSLFMASLRRRPCLAVYYTCPWFYPHCLSMLTLWKQFTDVMLFLIAVTVWSPCIVGMEICRAFVCCFFCTG